MAQHAEARFKALGKDFITYGLLHGLSKLISFLLLPILTRAFSPEEYGIVDIIAVLTSLLSNLAGLSLHSAVVRCFHEYSDHRRRRELVSTLFLVNAFTALVILLLALVFADHLATMFLMNSNYSSFILIGVASATFASLAKIPQAVLRMERRIVLFNVSKLTQASLYLGLALTFIFAFNSGLTGVFIAFLIGWMGEFVVATISARRYFERAFSMSMLLRSVRYSLPMLPAVTVTWINRQMDRFILLYFLALSSVGVFGASMRIGMLMSVFTDVFSRAWIPYAMAIMQAAPDKRDAFYRRALNYYAAGFSMLGILFVAFSPEVYGVLVPTEYAKGYFLLPWIIGAIVLHASANITNLGSLMQEKTGVNSLAALIAVILNISIGLILIPRFGLSGAAIGSFIAELCFTAILLNYTARRTSIRFHNLAMATVIVCYVTASISMIVIHETIVSQLSSLGIRVVLASTAIVIIGIVTLDKDMYHKIRDSMLQLKAPS